MLQDAVKKVGLRIRQARENARMSQAELARRLGYRAASSVTRVESGKVDLPQSKLAAFAKALNVTPGYLLGDNEPPAPPITVTLTADTRREVVTPAKKFVPVVGTVRCGPDGPAYENIDEYVVIDTNCRADEVKAIRCEGDSMTPDIHPGDLAFIHLQDDVPSGSVALCVIDGEEGTLKRVKYDSKRSFVVLESVNPEYAPRVFSGPDMQKVKVLGRVVETRRKW